MDLRETPARSARSERTHGRILEAAARCFAVGGYAKTTVEEIAAGAGVSKALVYHHFQGKEDVLQAVLERTLDEWHQKSGIDALASADSVLDGIERVQRATVEHAQAQPLLRALFQLDMLVVIGTSNQAVRDSMERFRRSLQTGIERGIIQRRFEIDGYGHAPLVAQRIHRWFGLRRGRPARAREQVALAPALKALLLESLERAACLAHHRTRHTGQRGDLQAVALRRGAFLDRVQKDDRVFVLDRV